MDLTRRVSIIKEELSVLTDNILLKTFLWRLNFLGGGIINTLEKIYTDSKEERKIAHNALRPTILSPDVAHGISHLDLNAGLCTSPVSI